jgi:hypothetical protein
MSVRMPFAWPMKVGGNRLKRPKWTVVPATDAALTVTRKLFVMLVVEDDGVNVVVTCVQDAVGLSVTVDEPKTVPLLATRATVVVTDDFGRAAENR